MTDPVDVPVCPADPDRTVAFAKTRWGTRPVGLTVQFANRRARRMRDLRSVGALRDAERYGWLTLASLWCGLGSQAALAVNATGPVDWTRGRRLPPIVDTPPQTVPIPGTSLVAADPRDPCGLWIADLAAEAATNGVVTLTGTPQAGTVVAAELAAYLQSTATGASG